MKRKKIIILHLAALICLMFNSCKDPTELESQYNRYAVDNYGAIKPLNLRYSWIYDVKTFDENRNIIDMEKITCLIRNDTVMENFHWYSSEMESVEWQTNKFDGLYYRYYDTDFNVVEWLEAAYPAEEGFSWLCRESYRTLKNIDTFISSGGRNFECHHYFDAHYDESPDYWEYKDIFYKPGAGMMKQEIYRETDGGSRYLYQSWEIDQMKIW